MTPTPISLAQFYRVNEILVSLADRPCPLEIRNGKTIVGGILPPDEWARYREWRKTQP